MAGASKKEKWTAHDGACTSCRTRKIRCGREKPECTCCRRDQVECVYSSPPKRVNHVKVLCQSFDDIQDRLITMQGELSWLTQTLKQPNISGRAEPSRQSNTQAVHVSPSFRDVEDILPPTTAGHVVRDDGTLIERYYGPWTLVAQCRDFETDMSSHDVGITYENVGSMIKGMLRDATSSNNDDLDFNNSSRPLDTNICLPPRQLLSVMLDTFLKHADYNTDIFCHSTIHEAIDRVYKDPSGPLSEAWSLCFNLIILLTLGAEHPVHSQDSFVRTMLQAAHATARKPNFLTTPRLVNVQALALFSLLTQQYHTANEALGDSIFARACLLARESGLHHANYDFTSSSTLSTIEAEERRKVFRSLYIRDRCSAISYGALAWLPSGSSRSCRPTNSSDDDARRDTYSHNSRIQYTPQWELAKLQDGFYHLLSSVDAPEMSTSERSAALSRLQQRLEVWSQTYKIPSSTRPTTMDDISLHLAFLGTRMRALEGSSSPDNVSSPVLQEVLNDARLCCLILVASCTHQNDQTLLNRLDFLLSKTAVNVPRKVRKHSSNISPSISPSSSCSPSSDAAHRSSSLNAPLSSYGSQDTASNLPPLHRLANLFPTSAVFVLARHILGMSLRSRSPLARTSAPQQREERQHQMNEDLALLEAMLFCFRSKLPTAAVASRGKGIHGTKLGRIIQHLVDIVHAVKAPSNQSDTEDTDSSADSNAMYAPEPLLPSTSHSFLQNPNSASMANLEYHSSNSAFSPSHLGLSPRASSVQPNWIAAQDSMSFSGTPLLTPGNSSYAPSIMPTPPYMADTAFDISQFIHQMGTNSPVMWNNGQRQAEMQMQMQQQQYGPQPAAEPTQRRSMKRHRTDGHD